LAETNLSSLEVGAKIKKAPRWRELKNSSPKESKKTSENSSFEANYGSISARIKAFIVDAFLIYTPILYITTYLILGGKDEFQHSTIAPFMAMMTYAIISSVFVAAKGQTPGKKAYDIKIVDAQNGEKINFIRAFLRFLLMLISCATILGAAVAFYRKDRRAFHDLVLRTTVVVA